MRSSMLAIALAIASTSAFGYENQDYTFQGAGTNGPDDQWVSDRPAH